MIILTPDPININQAYDYLGQNSHAGAINLFIGKVRDFNDGRSVAQFELEHYPQMAEQCLTQIAHDAKQRFAILDNFIIHRHGVMNINDVIVVCGASAIHRHDAIAATQMMMDYLKSAAPFWKCETTGDSLAWVAQKSSDIKAMENWNKNHE